MQWTHSKLADRKDYWTCRDRRCRVSIWKRHGDGREGKRMIDVYRSSMRGSKSLEPTKIKIRTSWCSAPTPIFLTQICTYLDAGGYSHRNCPFMAISLIRNRKNASTRPAAEYVLLDNWFGIWRVRHLSVSTLVCKHLIMWKRGSLDASDPHKSDLS